MTTEATTTPDDAAAERATPPRARRVLTRWWPYLVVVAVSLLASGLHIARVTEFAPTDESRHLDYMLQLYDNGHLVKLGDRLGQESIRLEACRGIQLAGFVAPPCDAVHLSPRQFRDDGFNNAVNNPPGYYVVTGAFTKAATGLGIAGNPLDPARVMSAIWLAAGLVLALWAGELLGVARIPLVSAAVIFAVAPEPLNMGSTVNADSASLFAGALVLVVALLWQRKRLGPIWLAFAGGAVALLKLTDLFAVGIVALWLLTEAYHCRRQRDGEADAEADVEGTGRRTAKEYVTGSVVLLGTAVVTTLVWIGIAGARATVDALRLPSNKIFYTPSFPSHTLLIPDNLFAFFPPLSPGRAGLLTTHTVNDLGFHPAWYLALAGLVALTLRFSLKDRLSTLAAWTTVVLIVGSPAFILSTWFFDKVIFQPVSRYVLCVVPIVILLVARLVRGRVGQIMLAGVAVLASGAVIGTLIFR